MGVGARANFSAWFSFVILHTSSTSENAASAAKVDNTHKSHFWLVGSVHSSEYRTNFNLPHNNFPHSHSSSIPHSTFACLALSFRSKWKIRRSSLPRSRWWWWWAGGRGLRRKKLWIWGDYAIFRSNESRHRWKNENISTFTSTQRVISARVWRFWKWFFLSTFRWGRSMRMMIWRFSWSTYECFSNNNYRLFSLYTQNCVCIPTFLRSWFLISLLIVVVLPDRRRVCTHTLHARMSRKIWFFISPPTHEASHVNDELFECSLSSAWGDVTGGVAADDGERRKEKKIWRFKLKNEHAERQQHSEHEKALTCSCFCYCNNLEYIMFALSPCWCE